MRRLLRLLPLFLAACGSQTVAVPLVYEPAEGAPAREALPVVWVTRVTDPAPYPERIGTALGNLGFPARHLESEPGTSRGVREAFLSALMARGLLAPVGAQRFDLAVEVLRLDARQQVGRAAQAAFLVTLRRHDTGQVVYRQPTSAARRQGGMLSLDTQAYVPVEGVTSLEQEVMNRAIEQALDGPAFQAAVHG